MFKLISQWLDLRRRRKAVKHQYPSTAHLQTHTLRVDCSLVYATHQVLTKGTCLRTGEVYSFYDNIRNVPQEPSAEMVDVLTKAVYEGGGRKDRPSIEFMIKGCYQILGVCE